MVNVTMEIVKYGGVPLHRARLTLPMGKSHYGLTFEVNGDDYRDAIENLHKLLYGHVMLCNQFIASINKELDNL